MLGQNMRTIIKLVTISSFITCISCNSIDFSNPAAVVRSFRELSYAKENEILYEDYLSSRSKDFVTKDQFIEAYNFSDSTIEKWKSGIMNVYNCPADSNNSSLRRYKVEEMRIVESDTFYSIHYYTAINEKGKWKIIWTQSLLSLASTKYHDGNYIEARKIVRQIIEISPFSGEAYNYLAWCYLRDDSLPQEEWEKGVVNNAKYAISLEEDNPGHYNPLAGYYSKVGKYDLAIQTWERGLKFCHNTMEKATCLTNLAAGYTNLRMYDKAEEYIRQSLTLRDHDAYVWFRYGILKMETHNYPEAGTCFERAISEPEMDIYLQGKLYYYYAYCCLNAGKCNVAKEYIIKALDIKPDNEEFQNLNTSIDCCR
jgi:tetratricopeptide (TPR) repeat protein